MNLLKVLLFATALFSLGKTACAEPSAPAASPSAGNIDLRLRLQKGQTIDQTVVVADKTSEVIRGERLDTYLKLRIAARLEVLDVAPSGESTLRFTYKSIAASENLNERLVYQYNSSHKGKNVPVEAEYPSRLVGQNLTSKLSPMASILQVEGVNELVKNLVRGNYDQFRKAERDGFLQLDQWHVLDKLPLLLCLVEFPSLLSNPHDSWTTSRVLHTLPIEIRSKHRILHQNDHTVSVALSSALLPHETSDAEWPVDGDRSKYLRGYQRGVVGLDTTTRWPRQFQIEQRSVMRMRRAVGGEPIQGQLHVLYGGSPIHSRLFVRGWARITPAPNSVQIH